jgi:hypothetical protein
MVLNFDAFELTTKTGIDRNELVVRMLTHIANYQKGKYTKFSNYSDGPARKARYLIRKMRRGYRPKWVDDDEVKHKYVVSGVTDIGYGNCKQDPYMNGKLALTIKKQDERRNNRLMSELMYRAIEHAEFMDPAPGTLMLPGPSVTEPIVSVAGTQALGYAPLIEPPNVIALDCKYVIGEVVDMPIELD